MSSSTLTEPPIVTGYRRDGSEPAVPATTAPREITADPMRPAARTRRQRRQLTSFLLAIFVPAVLMAVYLYGFAADQYVTELRFSVRHQAPLRFGVATGSPGEMPTGAAATLTVINESEMVVQYLKSRQIVEDIIAAGVDLDAIYAAPDWDFIAHLRPATSVEARQRYWRWVVDPFFDLSNGIISVEVRAFRPADSQLVAAKVLALAEKLMNDISSRAHANSLAYVAAQVDEADAKLKGAQRAIAAYRNQHAVLFPEMQATAATSVAGTVQQALIDARTAYSTQLAQGVSKDTSQMSMLRNRIAAMDAELQTLEGRLAKPGSNVTPNTSLASVLSEYSALQVSEQIAAKVYEHALTSLMDARNEASQQSVYLATFVRPVLPEDSLYPLRWRVMLTTVLVCLVAWCLMQLIYHGIRDQIN